jgi:hypothetical protein
VLCPAGQAVSHHWEQESPALEVAMEQKPRPKVLLDVLPGAEQAFDESFLSRNGVAVRVCAGPGEGVCPLVEGHGCRDFDDAKGIVFELDLDRPKHRAVLEHYRTLSGEGTPIRVVVTPEQAERYCQELSGVEIWTHEPTAADLDGFIARVEATERADRT